MTPYVAVVVDSFSETARSKVLWVLLSTWTILLLAIAPFAIIQGVTTDFNSDQILARSQLIDTLTKAVDGKATASQQAVWNGIEPDLKQQIIDRKKNNRGGRLPMGELAKGLSSVLDNADLYNSDAWPTASKRSDIGELLANDPSQLSKENLQRLNRRLVELAFPGMIRSGESSAIWVGYAGIKVSDPLPISKKQLQPFIEGFLLVTIMRIGLGIVGVFVGITITSSMIPEMFQPGSLHLLLSKPISRSGLLLAKFVGGTAFIAFNVGFLLVGFYLLVGWRLELWNPGILLCIPVFVFIFMIFYSVSTLAGLIWKNAIISIAITALFWGFCTTIGITHDVMAGIVTQWPKITSLKTVDETIFAVTSRSGIQIWDAKENRWQTAFGGANSEETVIGPFWIEPEKAIYMGRPYRIPFGGIQSDGIRLQIAKLPELSRTPQIEKKETTTLWSDKRIDSGPELPPRTRRVIAWNETLVALTERGLFRLDRQAALANEEKSNLSIFGFSIPTGKLAEVYPQMTPEDWQPMSPMDIAPSFDGKKFFVFSKGTLVPLESQATTNDKDSDKVEDQPFVPGVALELDIPDGSLALIAANHAVVLVATNKSGLIPISIDSWTAEKPLQGTESLVPRSIQVSPIDQSFVVLDRDGKLWQVSPDAKHIVKPAIGISEKVSAVHVDSHGHWWIAWGVNRVTKWEPSTGRSLAQIQPTLSLVESIYYRLVSPLYWINPKPAAVGSTLRYCVTSEDPFALGRETSELQEIVVQAPDFWEPLWSNALFICAMLGIGCSLLYRQDL